MTDPGGQLRRSAGVLIPLFSLRTEAGLGRGEILDLLPMMDLALAMGHRLIQMLPLDETAPDEASPYNALSIHAIDPLYISSHALRGIPDGSLQTARLSIGGRRIVERAKLSTLKLNLLHQAFEWFEREGDAAEADAFRRFAAEQDDWLADYALFRALKERFAFAPWESWPAGMRDRRPAAVERARHEMARPIRMYSYWQFLAHRQWTAVRLQAASKGIMLGGDLAFSPSRDSADVWSNRNLFDLSRTVGAPPDAFSVHGQRWGLPMPRWDMMHAHGWPLWRMRTRRARELYDVLRVDHVVGLYRTYSFDFEPNSNGSFYPAEEPAQRTQGEEIIAAIKHEAQGAYLIAEDLGDVPPWVRLSLSSMGLPGYKVMPWEKEHWGEPTERFISPTRYPPLSVATTGTHDTPALSAWWRDFPRDQRRQLLRVVGAGKAADGSCLKPEVLDDILRALLASPSILTIIPIQDLFGWHARINVPGTTRHTNWTYRLPLTLERMMNSPAVIQRLARLKEISLHASRFND